MNVMTTQVVIPAPPLALAEMARAVSPLTITAGHS
jgi:hypothetical protein